MNINKAGIELIKSFEGCVLHAYKDSVDVLTIGYGHTSMAGAPKVVAGMTITQAQAESILKNDLGKYEDGVESLVRVALNENQFSALTSFCFNLGVGSLKTSTLLKKLNAKDYKGAADEFLRWNKAGGKVLAGLTRRRQAERELFLKAVPVPAPAKVYHKVVSGENVTLIAAKYKTSIDAIKKLNPTIKDINKIYVGQSIRVK